MPTPYRKARLMGRLTLFATTLVAADLGMSLEAAPPQSHDVQLPAAAPDWNGSQMLLAGTGRRGSAFSSLFSRKKTLRRENGEDFLRPDFEDFVGPAGRRTAATRPNGKPVGAPPAVPPAGAPAMMTDLDALPALDFDLPPILDPVAQQQPQGVPAVPSLNGESTPAAPPQSRFRLSNSSDYDAVVLTEAELFPADVRSTPDTKNKKKTRNFLNLFPEDESVEQEVASNNAVDRERFVNADEEWPTDLYPKPEMGLMIDDPLIADDEAASDPLLDLPALDSTDVAESGNVAPPTSTDTPATVPPALAQSDAVHPTADGATESSDYWQTPRQVSASSAGWTALQRDRQQEQWRAAGSTFEANRAVPATASGWVASKRRQDQPTGVASTRTAQLNERQTFAAEPRTAVAEPAQATTPSTTVAMSPLAELPAAAPSAVTPPAVEPIPAHAPHVDGVDNAFVPGEEAIAANESLDLTPPPLDMTPTSEGTQLEEKVAKSLTNREGLTGLKGFCPVTLCEHRDLVDADPRFAAVYNDRTYYVSTYEALLQFQEDPEKYAPVVGGLDVVALARDGVEIDGILDHAAWYRGQLYLFATADLLSEFSTNPRGYAVE